MKLTASGRVYVLGLVLFLALAVSPLILSDRGSPTFLATSAVAGIAYLLAIREFFSARVFPRRVVIIGLVLAALWHLRFVLLPSGPDDDIRRYVWDGRLQRLGYNPYTVVPSDPAVSGLHTDETRNLNNPDVPSPYPAGAQLFFRAVTAIHESAFALKVAFVLCDFAIVFVLLDVLRRNRRGAHWVLVFAWNPLLAIEVAGSGHVDILGALLLTVSFAALGRRWRSLAAVAFGLAVAVKFLPVVLLPLYWKRIRMRDAVLAALFVGLLYLPFLEHNRIPVGSLTTYVQSFRFNDPLFASLERVARPERVAVLAVLVGFLTAVSLRLAGNRKRLHSALPNSHAERAASPECSPDVFAWPMAASLLCAPVIYPWYLIWLLPFLRSASTLPIMIWTVSIFATYVVWHLRALGRPWVLPPWVTLFEYGSVAAAGGLVVLHRLTRPAVSEFSRDAAG